VKTIKDGTGNSRSNPVNPALTRGRGILPSCAVKRTERPGQPPSGTLVRALTQDGQQLWSAPIPGYNYVGADGNGGIFVDGTPTNTTERLIDFDGQTGAEVWEYDSTTPFPESPIRSFAVAPNGNIYFTYGLTVDTGIPYGVYTLELIDGTTGAHSVIYSVPQATQTYLGGPPPCGANTFVDPFSDSYLTPPIVGPDGTVYAASEVNNLTVPSFCPPGGSDSFQDTLSLIQLPPSGSLTVTTVKTDTSGSLTAGAVIPDGNGGVLLSWGTNASSSNISDISSAGTSTSVLPSLGVTLPPTEMVLGDSGSGLAYALNGSNFVAFNIGGSSVWSYAVPSGYGRPQILAATAGGGLDVTITSTTSPFAQTLLSLDGTGTPNSSGVSASCFVSPWAVGNWVGYQNGLTSMIAGLPTNFSFSVFSLVQGGRQKQNASLKLQFSDFIPGAVCPDDPDPNCKTAQGAGAYIKANGGPPALVNHRIFAGQDENFPATIANFLKESASPRDAISFIGHSLVDTNPTCGTVQYSVGLIFVDGVLMKTPNQFFDPNNPCYNYAYPPPQPFSITYVSQINTNTKVVFIAACDDVNGVLASLWNISNQTMGQALVIPNLSILPKDNPGGVNLWQAELEWVQIASNLASGMTIQQAVTAANQYLQSIPLLQPPQAWLVVGDPNVQLRPKGNRRRSSFVHSRGDVLCQTEGARAGIAEPDLGSGVSRNALSEC
jgi:hypothetical protein